MVDTDEVGEKKLWGWPSHWAITEVLNNESKLTMTATRRYQPLSSHEQSPLPIDLAVICSDPDGSIPSIALSPPRHPQGESLPVSSRSRPAMPTTHPWWDPSPVPPAFGPLAAHERDVLSLGGLDEKLVECVCGRIWPRDLLRTPAGRAKILAPYCTPSLTVIGEAAMWIHTGGTAPSHILLASTRRVGRGPYSQFVRRVIPEEHKLVIAGIRVTTLVRTAIDLALMQTPVGAVEALLRARAHGIRCEELMHCLDICFRNPTTHAYLRTRESVASLIAQLYP